MKRMVLLMALGATAHAATYKVCWSVKTSTEIHCGESLSKKAANKFVAQANRDFPDLHYWVELQATPVDWNRARWAGAGAALAAGFFDARTTQEAIAAGGVEKNILYGSHPSAARLYGIDIGSIVGEVLLIEWIRSRHPESARTIDRNAFFGEAATAGVHAIAGIHNQSIINESKVSQAK